MGSHGILTPDVLLGLSICFYLVPSGWDAHRQRMLRAAANVGIASEEKLALHLGIDRGQLHRQMSDEQHFSMNRLAKRMPDAFWREYAFLLLVDYGLPVEAQRGWRMALALMGHKRMARASSTARRKKTA